MVVFTIHHLMIVGVSTFNVTLKMFHLTFRNNWDSLFPKEFVLFIKLTKLSLTVAWSTILVLQWIGILMISTVFIEELSELSVVAGVILTISYVWLRVPWWIYHSWRLSRTSSLGWAFERALVGHSLLIVVMLCHCWILSKRPGLTCFLL